MDELVAIVTEGNSSEGSAALGLVAAVRGPRSSFWLGIALSIVLPIEVFWGTEDKVTPVAGAQLAAHLLPKAVVHEVAEDY